MIIKWSLVFVIHFIEYHYFTFRKSLWGQYRDLKTNFMLNLFLISIEHITYRAFLSKHIFNNISKKPERKGLFFLEVTKIGLLLKKLTTQPWEMLHFERQYLLDLVFTADSIYFSSTSNLILKLKKQSNKIARMHWNEQFLLGVRL